MRKIRDVERASVSTETDRALTPVRRSQPDPLVLDLLVVDLGIVLVDLQAEHACRQLADRRQQRIGRDDAVALCGDQQHTRVEQRLLRVEHVEGGALADLRLLAHAVEGDLALTCAWVAMICAFAASSAPHAETTAART